MRVAMSPYAARTTLALVLRNCGGAKPSVRYELEAEHATTATKRHDRAARTWLCFGSDRPHFSYCATRVSECEKIRARMTATLGGLEDLGVSLTDCEATPVVHCFRFRTKDGAGQKCFRSNVDCQHGAKVTPLFVVEPISSCEERS